MMSHVDEIDAALIESMDDAIRSLLSQDVLDAFHTSLITKRSIKREEIPDQLPTVLAVLRKYFGPSAETIERGIAQRLYSKYFLDFQKNERYQLIDYVKDARDKLKPAVPSSITATVNLPLKDDFDQLFPESVKEAIKETLGQEQANLAFRLLERDVPFNKLHRQLPTFYFALRRNFGKDSGTIETAIARKLYEKLALEFAETPNTDLAKYVEMAFVKLGQREKLGLANISRT
jgi:hypothetical protein